MNTARDHAEANWTDLGERLDRAIVNLRDLADHAPGGVDETHRRHQKADAVATIRERWEHIGFRDDQSSFALLRGEVLALHETGNAPTKDACTLVLDYLRSY